MRPFSSLFLSPVVLHVFLQEILVNGASNLCRSTPTVDSAEHETRMSSGAAGAGRGGGGGGGENVAAITNNGSPTRGRSIAETTRELTQRISQTPAVKPDPPNSPRFSLAKSEAPQESSWKGKHAHDDHATQVRNDETAASVGGLAGGAGHENMAVDKGARRSMKRQLEVDGEEQASPTHDQEQVDEEDAVYRYVCSSSSFS